MTRRGAIALLGAAGLAPAAQVRFRTYSKCLPDYLTDLARQAYDKRSRAMQALRTPDAVRARQKWVRETFWQLVGGEPQRTPLNTRTVGSFERPEYRVEKLVYESQSNFHVSANLYLPKSGSGPFPGVLFQCGHSTNGKAAEPYQKCCQALAKLGYVVLSFDPEGQGERRFYKLPSADDEHDRAGRLLLLTGDTATRLQTWDAVRSLDVLASHPMVDPKRLATTGQSGGGTLSMLLMAVDDRLAAAAVSSGNSENFACAGFNSPGSVDDAEQDLIGAGPLGFDRWDLFYPFAPKPLLITVSGRDYFGTYSPSYLEDGRAEFERLRKCYTVLGREKDLSWYESPLPHALSRDMRLQVYNFFERVLKGSNRAVQEPETAPEPDEVLICGHFRSNTPAQLAKVSRGSLRTEVRPEPPMPADVTVLATAQAEHGKIEGVEVQVNRHVWLPGYLFWPSSQPKDALILLEPRGRTSHWREGDLYPRLAAAGHMVAAFDVRGIGDLSPEVGRGNQFYEIPHASQNAYAWASMMLGKPMLMQRITDIIAIVAALKKRPELRDRRIVLAALGHLTVPALYAAEEAKALDRLHTCQGLESFRSVLDRDPDGHDWFVNLVPGITHGRDLPDVHTALGDRHQTIARWDFATLDAL